MIRKCCAALLLALAQTTSATTWQLDAANSRLGFLATWEGTPFETIFQRFDADIRFDPQRPQDARIEVRVEVTSVDSASPDRDEGMGDVAWFDFANHPQARYLTSAVRAAGQGEYVADGELTLKGITKPVEVHLTWEESDGSARLKARAQVLRTEFNVGEGEWAESDDIGFEVRIFADLALHPAGD